MKKFFIVLICVLVLPTLVYQVNADQIKGIATTPTLVFSNTTAQCSATYTSYGDAIELTLSLWQGNTLVESWSNSGDSYVSVQGNASVERGKTYTLKLSGTCAGISISATSVSKKCQ